GCLPDEGRRVSLAHGDERDLARVAPRAGGARLDATPHLLDARAQTRRLRPRLDTHYCKSVANGDEYNKRARASATAPSAAVLPRCVHVSDFRHTKRYDAIL